MFDDLSPNAIIILVVMVIGGIRWFIEQLRGNKQGEDEAATSEFEDLYEETRLEILERQARNEPDPDEVSRQLNGGTMLAPVPVSAPPPLTPPPLPPGAVKPPSFRQPARPKPQKRELTAAEKVALANFQSLGETPRERRRRRQSSVSSQVRKLLSNPTSAQDAIVLADILGPPKGMR